MKLSVILNLKRGMHVYLTKVGGALFGSATSSMGMVTVAVAANNLTTFFIQVLATKKLGVEHFAVFALSMSLATWISTIGDMGFSLSGLRLFNKYKDTSAQKALLAALLLAKLGFLVGASLLGVIFGPKLAAFMGNKVGAELVAVAFISGGLLLFWLYVQLYFQAYRAFKHLSLVLIIYSLTRLAGLVFVFVFSVLATDPLMWLVATLTVPSFVVSFTSLVLYGRPYIAYALRHPMRALSFIPELTSYGKWVALSGIAYSAMLPTIQAILAFRSSLKEVAMFSAGMVFAQAFSTLSTALRTTLFPRVTDFADEEVDQYLKRLSSLLPAYAALMIVAIVLLLIIQATLLGETYRSALFISLLISIAFAVSLYVSLGTMLLHTFMRPDIDGKIDSVRLLGLSLFSYLLAPHFGATGVAVVYAFFSIGGAVIKMSWVKRQVEKSRSG